MRHVKILGLTRPALVAFAMALALNFVFVPESSGQTAKAPAKPAETPPAKPPEESWLAGLAKNPELVAELRRLTDRLRKELRYPPARTESRLVPLLPESTLVYLASANYGDVLHQALTIFREEREKSPALRDWWEHGELAASGPKLEDGLEKLYQFSLYLGDEVVVSGGAEGKKPKLLVVSELKKPGMKEFLQAALNEVAGKAKPAVRLMDPQELAAAVEKPGGNELLILVRPEFIAASLDVATLRNFNARIDGGSREFASTPFGQRVAQAYEGGATAVSAADLQRILSLIPIPTEQSRQLLRQSGFGDVKYAVWQHRGGGSGVVSEGELSFTGPRHGMASWLAAPRAPGSLDFVSTAAMAAGTVMLKDPVQIFEDVKEMATATNPNAMASVAQMEQALKISLKDDLLSLFGGEITFELDSFPPKELVWRAALRVNDAEHMQRTLSTLLAVANYNAEQEEEGGVSYHTIRVPSAKTPTEVGYAFVDGYMIVGSSRGAVAEAVRLHRSGEGMGKSANFQASLPPGHPSGLSAMYYQDTNAMTLFGLQRLPTEIAKALGQPAGEAVPSVVCAYGEETAIRGASTSPSSTLEASTMLIVAAIAIPNLLRSRQAANEASAVGTIRTVDTAQMAYSATYPEKNFAPDLATLGPAPGGNEKASEGHADLIDSTIGNASCIRGAWCDKSGYRFSIRATCIQQQCAQFVVTATPISADTGTRNFCSLQDGVIRYETAPPLTAPVSASECRKWAPVQ